MAFAVPGSLATPTGGYAYDARIIDELTGMGWSVDVRDLGTGFPFPAAATRAAAREILAEIPQGQPIVVDGLALGVMPDAAAELASAHPLIALVHHPLALEHGMSAEQADAMRGSERRALAHAAHVVVTSPSTARLLAADYDVAPDRVTVAPPGTDRATRATGSRDGTIALLAVGSLVPRKGYDVLLAALATLRDLPWRLTVVGEARDPAFAVRIAADIAALGLDGRIVMAGAVAPSRLAEFYDRADLFVLASRHEGYGMAFAEAIARGIPVIGTTAGAIPDTVPRTAGILVAPDDRVALAAALRRIVANADARAHLGQGAWEAAASLPAWEASARAFAQAIERAT